MVTKPTVHTHPARRLIAAARQRASPALQAAAGRMRRATASGLLVNLLVLAVTLAVVPLALRQITSRDAAPAREEKQAAIAPAEAAQPQHIARNGSGPVPARAGPVVYLVDSDKQAATVAQAVTEAERLAQDLSHPNDHGYPGASVVRLSSTEGLDPIALDVITGNGHRMATGLPLVRVVDLRAGAALKGGAVASGAEARATVSVVGSWLVSVPEPDGSIQITAQSFMADGGTIAQFTSADEQMGVSLGAGVWQATGGRTFVMSFRAPLYDPRTGVTVGVAMAAGSFTLDAAGDEWSGPARISFFAADGTLQSRTPEIPVSAKRVTLER